MGVINQLSYRLGAPHCTSSLVILPPLILGYTTIYCNYSIGITNGVNSLVISFHEPILSIMYKYVNFIHETL